MLSTCQLEQPSIAASVLMLNLAVNLPAAQGCLLEVGLPCKGSKLWPWACLRQEAGQAVIGGLAELNGQC